MAWDTESDMGTSGKLEEEAAGGQEKEKEAESGGSRDGGRDCDGERGSEHQRARDHKREGKLGAASTGRGGTPTPLPLRLAQSQGRFQFCLGDREWAGGGGGREPHACTHPSTGDTRGAPTEEG